MSNRTYKNEVSESIHSIAIALHQVGVIDDIKLKHYEQHCV